MTTEICHLIKNRDRLGADFGETGMDFKNIPSRYFCLVINNMSNIGPSYLAIGIAGSSPSKYGIQYVISRVGEHGHIVAGGKMA